MNRWPTRFARLILERLEDRTLLSAASVLAAITTARSWITYAPSTVQGDTSYPCAPSAAQIEQDLLQLYDEGWRNLVTYNLLGNYAQIPQIAKHVAVVHLGDSKRTPDREQNRCRLGEGNLPLREIIAALSSAGFDGYYDVELMGEEIEAGDYHSLLEHSKQAFNRLCGCAVA